MADKAPGPALPHLPHRLGGRLADIGPGKLRKLLQGLWRVRRLLGLAQRAHGLADERGLVLGELGGRLALAGRLGLLSGLVAFRGHHFGAGAVVVVKEQLAQKRLEVPLLHLLAQAGEDVLEAQVGRRVVVGVQPSGHGGHGQHHAVGVAEIALAHDELGMGEGRPHQLAIESSLDEAPGLGFHDGAQLLGGTGPGAPQGHHGEGLGHGIGHVPDGIVGDARVEQRPFQGRLVGPHDGVHQNVGGHDALALGGAPDDEAHGGAGVLRRGGHGHDHRRGGHGSLQPKGVDVQRPALFRGQGSQVPLVQKAEEAVGIQVAVQDDVGVVGTVVAPMVLEESLVSERRDGCRRAAGLEAVGRVREQRRRESVVEHGIRLGERALHLVVHHAVHHKARIFPLPFQLAVPALLLEDDGAPVDVGMEDRVQVDVHEVDEILLVGGRHRVHGLVREGHGV